MSITRERAIEILDPEHRECYGDLPDGYEQVDEACRMGMEALIRERDCAAAWHGHWIQEADRRGWRTRLFYHCSRCGRVEDVRDDENPSKVMPYCHCGAKMDEEVE